MGWPKKLKFSHCFEFKNWLEKNYFKPFFDKKIADHSSQENSHSCKKKK